MTEKYKPSGEEMENAEEMMSEGEREGTDRRETMLHPDLSNNKELLKICELNYDSSDQSIKGSIEGHKVELFVINRDALMKSDSSFSFSRFKITGTMDGEVLNEKTASHLYDKYLNVAKLQSDETQSAKTERIASYLLGL